MDRSKAAAFVNQNGSLLEKARLAYLLTGSPLPEDVDQKVLQPLLRLQNADGGFPSRPRPGSLSSVDSTLTALWQLSELGLFAAPPAQKALDFLAALQTENGGWDENPALPRYDLPPWIQPGDPATCLYLSAYAAFWLAVGGRTAQAAYQKGAAFLAARQEPEGKLPGYLHTTWIGAAALLQGGAEYAPAAEKALDYLLSRPFSEWDDSQIAWALDQLGQAGLPASHPFIAAALDELERRQDPDGAWAAEDGPQYAAAATVSALKALKRYDRA